MYRGQNRGKRPEMVIEEIWGQMSLKETIREIKRISSIDKEKRGMILVRLKGLKEKREVIEARKRLKGKREKIEDDLMMDERKAKWKYKD